MNHSRHLIFSLLLGLALLAGCERCGQIVWTADGSRAAWYSGEPANTAAIIDAQGKILSELGPSLGGFAWSADGQNLYFTSLQPSEPVYIDPSMLEVESAASLPASAPANTHDQTAGTSVRRYTSKENKPLFYLPGLKVLHLLLSPDQNWLAAVAFRDQGEGRAEYFELYAYSLRSGRLFCIANRCAMAVCFNAANHLVYVRSSNKDNPIGQLVEMDWDKVSNTAPQRTHLLDLLASDTFWVQPLGEDLLLTTRKAAFPAASQSDSITLFLFTPKNGALVPLAENVGPIFMPSPDGKFILLEQKSTDGSTLSLINANGSNPHLLRKLPQHLPMYPNWHSSDQITFAAPAEEEQASGDRTPTEVVQYKLVDGRLEPQATLSTHWPQSLKPSYHTEDLAATQPALSTQP